MERKTRIKFEDLTQKDEELPKGELSDESLEKVVGGLTTYTTYKPPPLFDRISPVAVAGVRG
jgi:hypothetical protein